MREIKSGIVNAEEQRELVVLQDSFRQHQGLVKANRFLLLFSASMMLVIFVLGFFLVPNESVLSRFAMGQKTKSSQYIVENPILSEEINLLKSQFVGLISGSIESKLKELEKSVRQGSIQVSLGAIESLRSDVEVLQAYSKPVEKKVVNVKEGAILLREVSQLKHLIYLTLSSCGLMLAAFAGFWFRRRYQLAHSTVIEQDDLKQG